MWSDNTVIIIIIIIVIMDVAIVVDIVRALLWVRLLRVLPQWGLAGAFCLPFSLLLFALGWELL